MKNLHDCLRVVLAGICPRTKTGCMMEIIAYRMMCDGRW